MLNSWLKERGVTKDNLRDALNKLERQFGLFEDVVCSQFDRSFCYSPSTRLLISNIDSSQEIKKAKEFYKSVGIKESSQESRLMALMNYFNVQKVYYVLKIIPAPAVVPTT